MPSVLIVDDLLSIHEMLDAVIQPTGYSTAFATDGEKGLSRYKAERFDIVLADIDMKPVDGITLLKQLKEYDTSAVVIIMTAYASTESAIQALKFGAFDYLQKPFRVDELIATLRRAVEFREFQIERAQSTTQSIDSEDLESRIVGSSKAMQRLRQQIKRLASVRTPVLLQGESGTGKSTIAEILHSGSADEGAELVRIDCSLSSESNFTQGLLGENGEGGAWVQKAKGGTLLLQRLEKLPFEMQKDLVSVLRNTAHRFRLLCTTTEDLELMTDEGRFHDELFYRVASLPVSIAPLREHTEDIPEIAKHIVSRATNPYFEASLIEFTDDARAVFENYRWSGNVAEFNQVVAKIAATTDVRMVNADQLPMRLKELGQWPTMESYLAEQKRQYIEQVLHVCRGDKAAAARVLQIDPAELG